MPITFAPYFFGCQVMHADDENVLVMRAIENAEFAESGRIAVNAPQKVVFTLFGAWNSERRHVNAARIQKADDMLDRAVFSGGIAPLKHDQYGMRPRAPEQILQGKKLFPKAD